LPLNITTNVFGLTNLNFINRMLEKHTQRISSGLRINSAADDPAGYAIATNLDAYNRSVGQAIRNTNTGVSFIQTAESANTEVNSLITRMREIAVQGSSDILTSSQRSNLQTELDEIINEVTRLSRNTEFNDINLTDGTTSTIAVQVGPNGASTNQITMTFGNLSAGNLGVSGLDVTSATSASAAITTIDTALDTVSGYAAQYGATQNRLDSNIRSMENYQSTIQSAHSNIMDADYAYETAEYTKYQTLQKAAIAVMAQANLNRQAILQLLK
jgi:flagellin